MANKSAFVLASCMGYSLIVNRFDHEPNDGQSGVGANLLDLGEHEPGIGVLVCRFAMERKRTHGQGVTIIDGGANIGHLSVFWSRLMDGASGAPWGRVLSFEPQAFSFYALAGNIALNNCFNAEAVRAALGTRAGFVKMPFHHPLVPFNFGGATLRPTQPHHKTERYDTVQQIAIDDLELDRLDILKLDIEGMEPEAISGAIKTIEKHRPFIIAEALICGEKAIQDVMPAGYEIILDSHVNLICADQTQISENLKRGIAQWKAAKHAA